MKPALCEYRPDLVLVYGDVNSTVASALVCSKLGVKVGHVEAGLRSGDRTMPEEINRLLTDQLSDLLFTPSSDGDQNLLREGIAPSKIHRVGNVMIDSLYALLPRTENCSPSDVRPPYALVTLHRPSNVDDLPWLRSMLATLGDLSEKLSIVFPVHPRTRQRLNELAPRLSTSRVRLLDPLPYLEFVALQRHAAVVITDSGGIQEETTFLGVPCLTVRENTERPITVAMGTNQLVGRDLGKLKTAVEKILSSRVSASSGVPDIGRVPLWDGKAANRIAEIVAGTSIS